MLLFIVAIGALTASSLLTIDHLARRQSEEKELIAAGLAVRTALIKYASATPIGKSQHPQTLNDLLLDPRATNLKRYLRSIPYDPISKNNTWGIIYDNSSKGIVGIYSLSSRKPLKTDNFPQGLESFVGKESYREWKFIVFRND